jgi:uncharacterized protein (TIGR01244 family)
LWLWQCVCQHFVTRLSGRFSCQWPSFKDLQMLPSHSISTPPPAPPVPEFVHLDSQYSVCSQLQTQHLMEAAAAGFTMIVNNRPDSELRASDSVQQQQPTSDVMQRAAHSLGLRYLHLPITPGAAAAAAPQVASILGGKQKVRLLLFAVCCCGSGLQNRCSLIANRARAALRRTA